MPGALEGIRVIDFTQHFAGPGTGMYLADQGAEVIKIEPPRGGHDRHAEPFSNPFLLLNRGKRSIVLDIRTPAGRDVAQALVKRADVMLVAWQPGQAERLGYGYEAMRELNPRLVYASITGWGPHGGMALRLGYDRLHQAFTGIMDSNRDADGTPMPLPFYLADEAIPPLLAYGIALALLARERTGQGQKVETSQLDAQIAMQSLHFIAPEGRELFATPSSNNAYRTSDGRHVVVMPLTREDWAALARALDLPPSDGAISKDVLASTFATRPLAEWEERLTPENVPFAPVLTRAETLQREQPWANGMLARQDHPAAGALVTPSVPVHLSGRAGEVGTPAPALGQHTRDILHELGYEEARIEALYAGGTVA
ncbi:MAG TPA: CoA transferase [Chloroflexota bacterium]|nr:CoA transferase [Chloroflexota bacterium]